MKGSIQCAIKSPLGAEKVPIYTVCHSCVSCFLYNQVTLESLFKDEGKYRALGHTKAAVLILLTEIAATKDTDAKESRH